MLFLEGGSVSLIEKICQSIFYNREKEKLTLSCCIFHVLSRLYKSLYKSRHIVDSKLPTFCFHWASATGDYAQLLNRAFEFGIYGRFMKDTSLCAPVQVEIVLKSDSLRSTSDS